MPLTPPDLPAAPEGDAPLYAVVDGMPVYRGHPLPDLVGVPFEKVWGLLVDGDGGSDLPPAEPFNLPVRTGDVRADVLSALAQLAPVWAYRPLLEISTAQAREDLARASVLALSFVAQSARGADVPVVPQREVDLAPTITEKFLVRWRGEADPVAIEAIESFWLTVAETGMVPSTRTARTAAHMGADAASCLAAAVAVAGAPFGGGAAARALALVDEAERTGDARGAVEKALARGHVPGFGNELLPSDVRVQLLRDTCARLGSRRMDVADEVARAGREVLTRAGHPGPEVNTLFWGAVLLDHAGVPSSLFSALYLCGRTAGWSAHVLDVQRRRTAGRAGQGDGGEAAGQVDGGPAE